MSIFCTFFKGLKPFFQWAGMPPWSAISPRAKATRWHQHKLNLELKPFWQVAWVRVETQTILTMNEHVITRNHRIKVKVVLKTDFSNLDTGVSS